MNSKNIKIKSTTSKLVYTSILIAISFIGSLIKIQGSIALDSMAGFFAALFLGPVYGGLVAGLGHLLTAATSGFLLTIPIHIVITLEMAVSAYIFGIVYRKFNSIIASIVGILLNGIVAVLILMPITTWLRLPLNGKAFFAAMVGPLSLASVVNIVLACVVYKIIEKRVL
ncbi:ECF transporter S component [Anaerosalibacter massiliensis]|uniref:ECF transporter S component n=1 Tax=Anaerosalibacter massiliensis TaxID=1347392 RepID=UPI000BE8E126|nr:ECF transporter S component [Anaerosalibacter massiliensis]